MGVGGPRVEDPRAGAGPTRGSTLTRGRGRGGHFNRGPKYRTERAETDTELTWTEIFDF